MENTNPNSNIQISEQDKNQNTQTSQVSQIIVEREYKWYRDRPTLIALISGFFSSIITIINALFR